MLTLEKRLKLYKEVAETYGRTQGALEIAKKYGVSKQHITSLAGRMRKGGIELPRCKSANETLNSFIKDYLQEK
jgi:transposase